MHAIIGYVYMLFLLRALSLLCLNYIRFDEKSWQSNENKSWAFWNLRAPLKSLQSSCRWFSVTCLACWNVPEWLFRLVLEVLSYSSNNTRGIFYLDSSYYGKTNLSICPFFSVFIFKVGMGQENHPAIIFLFFISSNHVSSLLWTFVSLLTPVLHNISWVASKYY